MPNKHPLARTTHTVEMAQIAELNDHLAIRGADAISAGDLGLADATARAGGDAERHALPAQAVLERVTWDGSPDFPYIHAHFRPEPAEPGRLTVDLHTRALRELSRLLHVREVWGIGTADDGGRTGPAGGPV